MVTVFRDEIAARPKPLPVVSCHRGRRAPRYVENLADLQANPDVFRCQWCWMILDGPR